jgi:hypothetical protein
MRYASECGKARSLRIITKGESQQRPVIDFSGGMTKAR